jgi:hypothetical protein
MLSEAKFLELWNRHQECGLDVTAFCSNEGIAKSTFYYWRKKLQRKENAKGFIPLVVKPERTSLRGQQYKTLRDTNQDYSPQAGNDDYFLEVIYINGTKLRIKSDLDLTRLRALVYLID